MLRHGVGSMAGRPLAMQIMEALQGSPDWIVMEDALKKVLFKEGGV